MVFYCPGSLTSRVSVQVDSDDGLVYLFTAVLSSYPPVYSEAMLVLSYCDDWMTRD